MLLNDVHKSKYVRIRCLSANLASDYLKSMADLSPVTVFNQTLPVQTYSTRVDRPKCASSVCSYSFVTGGRIMQSTSHKYNRLASMVSHSYYIGSFNQYALVYQTSESLKKDSGLQIGRNLESLLKANQSDLPLSSISQYIPDTSDYPVGFIFNYYNTHSEVYGALPFTAQWYAHMMGTPFDIGRVFGENAEEYSGVTISFWLRASSISQGYVFALTDFYKDTTTDASPILDLAHKIISSGQNASRAWFESSFHLYYGLFIDASSQVLRLNIADPIDVSTAKGMPPIVALEWRLADIGQTQLFNDQWHQVRLIFLKPEMSESATVRLVIDSTTSYANDAWTQCLGNRGITPIRRLPDTVAGLDSNSEVVYQEGVMIVGYFNGGVWGLEVDDKPLTRGALVLGGVKEVVHSMEVTAFEAMAAFLLFFALVLLLGAVYTFRSVQKLKNEEEETMRTVSEEPYDTVVWSAAFRKQTGYYALPLNCTLELLQLSTAELMSLLEDLNTQKGAARMLLVRMLWKVHLDADKAPDSRDLTLVQTAPSDPLSAPRSGSLPEPPRVEEWNNFVSQTTSRVFVAAEKSLIADPSMGRSSIREMTSSKRMIRVALLPSVGDVVLGFLHAVAGVTVYATAMQLPQSYSASLVEASEIVMTDFSQFFKLEALVTPVVQGCIVIVVFVVLIYVAVWDHRRFVFSLAKFTGRRDAQDARSPEERQAIEMRSQCFETRYTAPSEVVVLAELLPTHERLRLENFVSGLDESGHACPPDSSPSTLQVRVANGSLAYVSRIEGRQELAVRLPSDPSAAAGNPLAAREGVSTTGAQHTLGLLGVYCPHHHRLLTTVTQNDVYPYANRRTCSAVENGVPCNRHIGAMYVCNKHSTRASDGEACCCNYALCERHWRPTSVQVLVSKIVGCWRVVEEAGWVYALTTIIIFLITALYMPFMRTSILVLSCHPFYRCSFGRCWESLDADFAIAAYCAIVTVILFGAGIPICYSVTIWRRHRYLSKAFERDSHHPRYENDEGNVDLVQWTRFLTSDDTAMSSMYSQLLPQRIAFLPLFLVFKTILVLCALLCEPNTPLQMVIVAIAEISYGLFTLVASPFISPWTDCIYRLGAAHQLSLLGFQSIHSVGDASEKTRDVFNAGLCMIFFSSLYLFIVAAAVVLLLLKPLLEYLWRLKRRRSNLQRFGLPASSLAPLYVGAVDGTHVLLSDPIVKTAAVLKDEQIVAMKKKAVRTLRRVANAVLSTVRMSMLFGTPPPAEAPPVSASTAESPRVADAVVAPSIPGTLQPKGGDDDEELLPTEVSLSYCSLWDAQVSTVEGEVPLVCATNEGA